MELEKPTSVVVASQQSKPDACRLESERGEGGQVTTCRKQDEGLPACLQDHLPQCLLFASFLTVPLLIQFASRISTLG